MACSGQRLAPLKGKLSLPAGDLFSRQFPASPAAAAEA